MPANTYELQFMLRASPGYVPCTTLDVGVRQPYHIQSEALGRQDGVGQSVDPIECLVGIMFW